MTPVSYTHLDVYKRQPIYRVLNLDGEKMRRQMEEERRQMREESDQLRRKIEEGFAKLHGAETRQGRMNRNTKWFDSQVAWREEEEMDYRYQRWEDERKRKEAFEEELRYNKIRRNEELFYSQAVQWEEEEMSYRNQRREDERKRREAFEEELKRAKKLKNEKRPINEDLMKNKENTDGNENHLNEKSENDHNKTDAMEPLPENIDKDTQDLSLIHI